MRERGFTIIETTVVMALIAAITAITLPRASSFLDRIAVRSAVTDIESVFSLARHSAIARGSQVSLDIDPASGTMAVRTTTETLRHREIARSHGVSISTNRTTITYSPIGVGYGAANLSLIVNRNRAADTVVVSRLGRVRH